jgi:hypothetical protein
MSIRRAFVGCGALFAAFVVGTPGASAAPGATTTEPAPAAAGWLATRLVDGNHLEVSFDGQSFPDAGLTADAILAFDGAGVAQSAAAAATTWLAGAATLSGYIGDGDAESYAGAHAKAALVALAQGLDPTDFGGRDLLAELRDLQATSGRFSDRSQFGDFSNSIGQSLALISLDRAGGTGAPAAAVAYLVGSQCDNGGFPLNFEQPQCTVDPDSTAFAVQALLAVGQDGPAGEALDYLGSIQAADGGFGGSGPTAAENSNSTGLVVPALRAGGRDAAADRAVGYLLARQVGCGGQPVDQGAIAYDTTPFTVATAVRATAQAVLGLSGTGLAQVSASGAAADAPRLACAPPTTVPPTTVPPTTQPPTTAAPTAPGAGAGGGGSLPATGTPVGVLSGVAALLLVSGAGLVLIGRRRLVRGAQTL